MHVRGVAGEQHTAVAVGGSLARHVGEPGDPGRAVQPEVRPVRGDERLAEIRQAWGRRCVRRAVPSARPERPSALPPVDGTDARHPRDASRTPAPRPSRPRRSSSWSTDPTRGSRCRRPCGSRCVRRRSRRGTPRAATCRRTARRRRRCRPARSPPPRGREGSEPRAHRPSSARMRSKSLCHSAST